MTFARASIGGSPATAKDFHGPTLPKDAHKTVYVRSMCGPKFRAMEITNQVRYKSVLAADYVLWQLKG